ncbi:MAG: hypothetical protein AVDCRST_MAG93-7857 [uncultured Chloroflexia bacterium]|uniref:Uncharacterized protein n=1 Tax=uncultured Chloroflexia bacterium TaxID=1672391 RepID=A0A6J4MQH6_9CHLR|nr:MAG: hypothetical protein AVDCRST_MAG93-7857 [uncultured Chloroflexia bacterium]
MSTFLVLHTPVIDRAYPLSETPEAIGHVGGGHARGKIAITVPEQGAHL